MKQPLKPYTDKIPEPPHGEPNGEHVGHFRIIVFDQHNGGEMRFGVDIALKPEYAKLLAEYIAKDDRLFAIFEQIFGIAIRKRLSNDLQELGDLFADMFNDDDNHPKHKNEKTMFDRLFGLSNGGRGKIKIPDGMTPDAFAALMREAFNGTTCDCPECLAVRERRKHQPTRNTKPDAN